MSRKWVLLQGMYQSRHCTNIEEIETDFKNGINKGDYDLDYDF